MSAVIIREEQERGRERESIESFRKKIEEEGEWRVASCTKHTFGFFL